MGARCTVHPSVDIQNPERVRIGKQSQLYKQVSIYPSPLGSFKMGDHSHVAPFGYFLIADNSVVIGDHVAIGPFCVFVCHSNAIEGQSALYSENYLDADIQIGNNVFIGSHCTILPGSTIGDNVVVAANAVVKGNLEANSVYAGSPAKMIKRL